MTVASHLLPRLAALAAILVSPGTPGGDALAVEWSRFRGPGGHGVFEGARIPDPIGDARVVWRAKIGRGHSSPVIHGSSVYLTDEADSSRRRLLRIDATDGSLAVLYDEGFEPHPQHRFNAYASSTPAVGDGRAFVLWTSGERLFAIGVDARTGERIWRREVGTFSAQHGHAVSPVIFGDTLVVANEHESDGSFLAGYDAVTGNERWRIERSSRRASYATPVVLSRDPPRILFSSTAHGLTCVDPSAGTVEFELDLGFRQRFVASPAVLGDRVFVSAGSGGGGKEAAVVEIEPTASGGAGARVSARPDRNLPYVPQSLALAGRFFLFSDGGVASVLDARTGEVAWRERLDGTFFSSPVSDGERILIGTREGTLFVLAIAPPFGVRSRLDLDEPIFATPALTGDGVIVRTNAHVWKLASDPPRRGERAPIARAPPAREDDGGWIDLFNGRDLEGWTPKIRGFPLGEDPLRTFRAEDGVIKVRYDQYEKFDRRFGHLFADGEFESYDLEWEYRFVGDQVSGGPGWAFRNSGFMILGQDPRTMRVDQDFPVSIEVQLLGGGGSEARPTGNLCTPGTNVVMNGELVTRHCTDSTSPTFHGDRWVRAAVSVRPDGRITHFVEGQVVLEYEQPQLDERDADARAWIERNAGRLRIRRGTISIQSESHPCEFRNIRIRPRRP